MPRDEDEIIETAVGVHIGTENYLRGYAVQGELVGHDGFWSCLSLALGGPRLSRDDEALLDDMSTCANATESRVWPLKLTRILASYGDAVAGLGGGLGYLSRCVTGPAPIRKAAADLLKLRDEIGEIPDDDAALLQAVRPILTGMLAAKTSIAGFGAFSRDIDERRVAIEPRVRLHGRERGAMWRLLLAAERVFIERKNMRANCAVAVAAPCLDMGYDPMQIELIGLAILLPNFIAVAHEGAVQSRALLRALPEPMLEYVGTPARQSAAKLAAEDAVD